MNYINAYCRIDNSQVIVTNNCILPNDEDNVSAWASYIYKSSNIQYPKFFKMDTLCKFGFLASEFVMRKLGLSPEEPKKDWAIVCLNSCSSIDTDRRYQSTIQDADNYFPSPSVFVYTLPNIVTGEIAIRNKYHGETSFMMVDSDRWEDMQTFVEASLQDDATTSILTGWVDFYDENHFETNLKLLIKNK